MFVWLRQHLSSRSLVLAALGAVSLFLVCVALLFSALHEAQATTAPPRAAAGTLVPTSTTTLTATATHSPARPPTATVVKSTATPHPLPVPKDNPPPPPPPRQPTPTATHAPPTATATNPTTTLTPCPTGGCPTATSAPPTATPGPCQPGGAPYYKTPEPTPTGNQIAAAITSAANANGIPPLLEEAIAWQESGWQINLVACDGGIGLAQLQPATVAWLNSTYGIHDDPYSLAGNADLSARYLHYYYSFYIGYLQQNEPAACGTAGCNWDTPWPGATDGANVRDIVISVYNEGAGTMNTYGIINWWYVNDVLLWQNQMPWAGR
ncbi:MAG: lytic transglycosylase domain-containing protein [Ktedonobacterales bacterium]|nr:lytic transglycosylase domain-containing protein [Ktedonobacterales bacterium]